MDPFLVGLAVFAVLWGIGCVVEGLMYLTVGRGIFRPGSNAPASRPRLRGLSFLVLSPTLLIQAIYNAQSPHHINFGLVALNMMLFVVGVALFFVSRRNA